MQDPDNTVDGLSSSGALHDTSPTSPVRDAYSAPFAPFATDGSGQDTLAQDEATKKAVDSVLYSDVCHEHCSQQGDKLTQPCRLE